MNSGVLGQLLFRANEHVAGEVLCRIVVHHADGQGFRKVGAAVQILHEQSVLLNKNSMTLARIRTKVSMSVETLTSPQLMSLETEGSSTMNLSLGERPVRSRFR